MDAAVQQQLEEMGFSAHRCGPWDTLSWNPVARQPSLGPLSSVAPLQPM